VRAFSADPDRSRALLEDALAFEPKGEGWEARGERRGSWYAYDKPPAERGIQGAGTVHHVAWASHDEEHERWRDRVIEAGAHPTPVIDRFWFHSIYFREPSGVLFELATFSPGFAADEDAEHLGESLVLPPWLESRREQIEAILTPISNPRQVTA
jgi:glyoxalase family protein